MTITLPIRTENPVNGGQSWHWATRARKRRQERSVALMATIGPWRAAKLSWPILVRLTRIAPSSGLDDDNLRPTLKSIRDGIADALGVNDRDPRVTWDYAQRRGKWAVEVEIKPAEQTGKP